MGSIGDVVGFPAAVNEKAARVVAGGVVLLGATALLTGWLWLSAVLALGFGMTGFMVWGETDAEWEHTPEFHGIRHAGGAA